MCILFQNIRVSNLTNCQRATTSTMSEASTVTDAPAAAGTGPGAGSSDDDEKLTRKRQRMQPEIPEEPEGGCVPVLFWLSHLTDGISEEITGASTYLVTGPEAERMYKAYYRLFPTMHNAPDCEKAREDLVLGPLIRKWDTRDEDDKDCEWNKWTLHEWNKDSSNPLARQLPLFMM